MIAHLKRAVAKDCSEDRGRKVGDDGQQDCHAGCHDYVHDITYVIELREVFLVLRVISGILLRNYKHMLRMMRNKLMM